MLLLRLLLFWLSTRLFTRQTENFNSSSRQALISSIRCAPLISTSSFSIIFVASFLSLSLSPKHRHHGIIHLVQLVSQLMISLRIFTAIAPAKIKWRVQEGGKRESRDAVMVRDGISESSFNNFVFFSSSLNRLINFVASEELVLALVFSLHFEIPERKMKVCRDLCNF